MYVKKRPDSIRRRQTGRTQLIWMCVCVCVVVHVRRRHILPTRLTRRQPGEPDRSGNGWEYHGRASVGALIAALVTSHPYWGPLSKRPSVSAIPDHIPAEKRSKFISYSYKGVVRERIPK